MLHTLDRDNFSSDSPDSPPEDSRQFPPEATARATGIHLLPEESEIMLEALAKLSAAQASVREAETRLELAEARAQTEAARCETAQATLRAIHYEVMARAKAPMNWVVDLGTKTIRPRRDDERADVGDRSPTGSS